MGLGFTSFFSVILIIYWSGKWTSQFWFQDDKFHSKSRWGEYRKGVRKGLEMWWFERWEVGVNIWMCRYLYWFPQVDLFRTAHLVLCPRFVTKAALTEPQCLSFGWTALSSVQDFCFLWPPTLSGVGTQPGQPILSDQRHSKMHHIMLAIKAAAGWAGVFSKSSVLRNWVGIDLLVPSDGFFICLFSFFPAVITLSLYLNHQVFLAFVLEIGYLMLVGGNEQVAVWDWPVSWGQFCPLSQGLLNASQILSPWVLDLNSYSWLLCVNWAKFKCFPDKDGWYWCAIWVEFFGHEFKCDVGGCCQQGFAA